ncbi:UDP-glucosyltransferase 2-like [Colias croceus]|uniref:UDP-glucosyltransferase 2-like n=1 Tax=Colias crocea TaxID=72248 RepID=UPI001E27FE2A|nr:UDP-glucosyltransferase 2-like [Colias croceus]
MAIKPLLFLLLFCVTVPLNDALRFLVFVPVYTKSHSILGHAVVDHLLDAGHEVVHITSHPKKKIVPKLQEIDVLDISMRIMKQYRTPDALNITNIANKGAAPLFFITVVHEMHKQMFEDPEIRQFFNDPEQKFDAVIVEWLFSHFVAGIAPLFKCPLIWLVTTQAHWQVLDVVDEISNPAFSADIFSINIPPFTTWQRFEELWALVKRSIEFRYFITPAERRIYDSSLRKIAQRRGVVLPPYEEAIYNGSLLLINSHPSIGQAYRLPQNAKYVAGFHIHANVKPLPKDLQHLMDTAKHGAIYFSMGSHTASENMSDHMKNSLLLMFSKLRETVIWKFEGEMQNVPENVYLVKWAPQQSILAHPNLKLFITHGGQLSTTEAIHFGVPVIGIPTMGDQHINMRTVVQKGFGITVNLAENMAADLYKAIKEVSANPIYKRKADELSRIYHDRPLSPKSELLFWIEHVVKTKGALHLRSPALQIPMYKKMYIDLIVFQLIVMYLLFKIARSIVCKQNKVTRKKVKKN